MGDNAATPQQTHLPIYCSYAVKSFIFLVSAIVLFVIAVEIRPSSETTGHIRVWRGPRPLASSAAAAGPPSSSDSRWQHAAQANLTAYRNGLLGWVRQYYGKKEFWNVFVPVISCPADRPLTRYGGTGDGSKLLCKISDKLRQKGCVIYSLGSNGHYGFEQSMLNETICEVHTFDCTYNGTAQHSRHVYHKWCVGDPKGGQQYRTWNNITVSLGHRRVDLLKMDIEGYEHDVLPTWMPDDLLPDELSMEFHVGEGSWPVTTAELAVTFGHLANLGYAAYAQEVNAGAPHCCSEFTFMRVKQ